LEEERMLQGLRTVIYHVDDLERAKGWYGEVLGKEPYFDEPLYVGSRSAASSSGCCRTRAALRGLRPA